jgi:hypothetical protein
MERAVPTVEVEEAVPADLEFPDNDPAYIEALRTTFQFQGVADDTRAEWVRQHLAEDY